MQNDKRLLSCPFCGGEAIKVAFTWANIADESTIDCTVCGARTKVLKTEEAIKKWNTRKPMERIDEQRMEQILLQEGKSLWGNSFLDGLRKALDIVRKGGVDNAG